MKIKKILIIIIFQFTLFSCRTYHDFPRSVYIEPSDINTEYEVVNYGLFPSQYFIFFYFDFNDLSKKSPKVAFETTLKFEVVVSNGIKEIKKIYEIDLSEGSMGSEQLLFSIPKDFFWGLKVKIKVRNIQYDEDFVKYYDSWHFGLSYRDIFW